MRLPDDAINAAWSVYDATGIRPEWLLPVLYAESGFDPSAHNSLGYLGVGQDYGPYLERKGIDPTAYVTWSAAQQIEAVIEPRFAAIVKTYGGIGSATRAYQGNLLPASLPSSNPSAPRSSTIPVAPALWSVLARKGSSVYDANAQLSWLTRGAILVADLAHFVARAASSAECATAIVRAYALRSNAGSVTDPVYGRDFRGETFGVPATLALTAAATGVLSRSTRR